jgi:hypothetical protein
MMVPGGSWGSWGGACEQRPAAGSTLPATCTYLFPCRPFKILLWVHRSLLIIHDRLVKMLMWCWPDRVWSTQLEAK